MVRTRFSQKFAVIASLSSTLPVTKNQSTMPYYALVACSSVKCISVSCSNCPCGHPVDVGQGGAAEEVRAILMKLRASRFCGGGCQGPPPLQGISRGVYIKVQGMSVASSNGWKKLRKNTPKWISSESKEWPTDFSIKEKKTLFQVMHISCSLHNSWSATSISIFKSSYAVC